MMFVSVARPVTRHFSRLPQERARPQFSTISSMIKGKEILNRPIVTVSNGEKVASVLDVVFDPQGNQVLALLTEAAGLFRAAEAVPFERIRSIGENAVMIASPDDIVSSRDHSELAAALKSKTSLIGLTLLTTEGENLGRIADVYFDQNTGAVVGYEATGGLFADLSNGRSFVPAPREVQIGADAAIVPNSVAAAMKEHPGGIRGALKGAGEAVTGAFQSAGDSVRGAVQEASQTVKEGYQEATESVKETVQDVTQATKERQKAFVIGKVAGTDVTLENGLALVHKGDVITEAQAEAAQRAGKLGALTAAATGGELGEALGLAPDSQHQPTVAPAGVVPTVPTMEFAALPDQQHAAYQPQPNEDLIGRRVLSDVRTSSGSFLAVQGQIITAQVALHAEQTGLSAALRQATEPTTALQESLSSGVESVKESASQLLSKAKAWLTDRRDETEQALWEREGELEEQRIKDALGRPVTRVILAPDDSIILNVGEIVTNKAVAEARNGNVLDMLLSSVSKEAPNIDPLAVRPDEQGKAALESQPNLSKGSSE